MRAGGLVAIATAGLTAVGQRTAPDTTAAFIAQLDWPVDIVLPKYHHIAPVQGYVAPYCNLNLLESLKRGLFMDEEAEALAYADRIEHLLALVSDMWEVVDTKHVGRVQDSVRIPAFLDADALPEVKLRLLISAMVLAAQDSAKISSLVAGHTKLESKAERVAYVKNALDNPDAWVRTDKVKGVLPDDKLMDSIPDTLIGFLSSRVMTGVFSEFITDALGQGLSHDFKKANLSDGFCRGFSSNYIDFIPDVNTCMLMTIITAALSCSRTTVAVDCAHLKPERIDYAWSDCERIPEEKRNAAVVDLEYLPMNEAVDATAHNLTAAARNVEGPSLYAMQLAQMHWDEAVSQRWCQTSIKSPQFIAEVLPGWPIVREVWVNEESSLAESTTPTGVSPFSVLAKKEGGAEGSCEFLLVTRGTITGWEWAVNLMIGHTALPMVGDPKARGHYGYAVLAESIVQSLNAHFIFAFESGECVPQKTTVWFTGHSLGGGQTNMLSLLFAGFWRNKLGDGAPTVNSFGMASTRLFNVAARQLQEQWVNVRNFVFEYDLVPGMACLKSGIHRCNPKYWSGAVHGTGDDDSASELAGLVRLRGDRDFTEAVLEGDKVNVTETLSFFDDGRFLFMPTGSKGALAASMDKVYINIPTTLQLGVNHICAYHCYTSRNFCSLDPEHQIECVRALVNANAEDNCMNADVVHPDNTGSTNRKLSSLNCSPEFWGYDKVNVNLTKPYVCPRVLPGLGATTIIKLLKGGDANAREEL